MASSQRRLIPKDPVCIITFFLHNNRSLSKQRANLAMLFNNFNLSTWIAMILFFYHAALLASGATIPRSMHGIAVVALAYLVARFSQGLAVIYLGATNPYAPRKTMGKFRGVVCDVDGNAPEKAGGNGVVCFIVGAQLNQ